MEPVPRSTHAPPGLPFREVLSCAALQAGWEPTKALLVRENRDEDLRIRIHRACRALEQAELLEQDADDACGLDVAFILRWVALNALYGRWDREGGMSVRDRVALDRFTSGIVHVDEEGRLLSALEGLRDDARAILESPFLIERFWAADEWENVRPQRGRMSKFNEELREDRVGAALHRLLISIYFLRCQMVHGCSTVGGSVNRPTVEPAARILRLLVGQILALVIERGTAVDFGELCYPPVR